MFLDLIREEQSTLKNKENSNSKWFKDENDKIFFIENKTGRKRFGRLINCENCNEEVCVRIKDTKKYCGRVCAQKARRVERLKLNCASCNKEFFRTEKRLQLSKKGFNFCDRKCKEKAQQIGGIEEIQPSHYGDGTPTYAERAFRFYGEKCTDCEVTFKPLLEVHHIDGNRDNGSIDNLEVVCKNHHLLRHLKYNKKDNNWTLSFKSLTPREKLKDLKI